MICVQGSTVSVVNERSSWLSSLISLLLCCFIMFLFAQSDRRWLVHFFLNKLILRFKEIYAI
jgi:uncharacterized membrane protein YjjP (DUF1212 family)